MIDLVYQLVAIFKQYFNQLPGLNTERELITVYTRFCNAVFADGRVSWVRLTHFGL